MGEAAFKQQIEEKLAKDLLAWSKIGAIDFDKELGLLRYIRQHFTQNRLKLG
jgi:hypothetical protein